MYVVYDIYMASLLSVKRQLVTILCWGEETPFNMLDNKTALIYTNNISCSNIKNFVMWTTKAS